MLQPSDKELLELFRTDGKSQIAFRLLMKKYQEKVYFFVRRMVSDHDDANDLVQDIFLKAWKNLSGFREDSGLYTWLYRIAINETLSFLKNRKIRATLSLSDPYSRQLDSIHDDRFFTGDEVQRRLQEAIISLPDKQKVVFNLRYYEDMPYEEMSVMLNTSVGALKASYHFAVKKIENSVLDH